MSNPEILRGIAAADVQAVMDIYVALGAHPTRTLQTDETYTVSALFDETRQVAPLAMAAALDAVPVASRPLLEPMPKPMAAADFPAMAAEYRRCFDLCQVRPAHAPEVKLRVARIMDNARRYKPLAADTNMPWYFIAIVHMMESNTNFNTHLHNGDPLAARTVHVPAGRPTDGAPPFTWEASAYDALHYEGFTGQDDWNTATMLYRWERFNGMGNRAHGIFSPYLWSYSNLYEKGRFVRDHVFDPNSVSKQCGAGVLLKALQAIL